MILDRILEHGSLTDVIHTDNPELVFSFLHEAVLDSRLYIAKAIGFQVSVPDMRARSSTYIARHTEIADSYVEIMKYLQDKIFLTRDVEVSIPLRVGVNTMETTTVVKSRKPVECRYVDPYICRVLRKECSIKLVLALGNGYMDMQKCSSEIGPKYFPLYTYFYLGDFVRILPPIPGDKTVRLRYYHGFTGNDFTYILQENSQLFHSRNMKEDTRKWMLSFGQ